MHGTGKALLWGATREKEESGCFAHSCLNDWLKVVPIIGLGEDPEEQTVLQ